MLKTSQVLRNLANKHQRISSLDISHSFSSFPMDFSKRIMTFVQTKRHKDMKKPFFILKSIALFVALMWGMSLPCIADKKPIPTIDPIELEGKIEDERDRTLLLPVEAWTNGND